MAKTEESPENIDEEVAMVADTYLRERKKGTAGSIDSIIEEYSHLGDELRESLEAIDLLFVASPNRAPEILGDFRIHQELGRGGMGIVYLATQTSLQRKVALKVLRLANDEQLGLERFQREAQTIAALRHDHIVPVFAVGEVDGMHFLAMQLIDGESVAQSIDKWKGIPFSRTDERERRCRIARWGAQIADALEYAHKQGIVHRDIKPSNLLMDHELRIWLTDFGLARHDEDLPASHAIAYQGTPKYMSPEQASAIVAQVDHRTDIYSLGVTLIEWLTTQSIVGGSSPVESLSRLQQNSVEESRILLRGYSRDWISVLAKCIAREPKDRYQSAAALATDLRAIVDHRPVAARPQHAFVRQFRTAIGQKSILQTAVISALAADKKSVGGHVKWILPEQIGQSRIVDGRAISPQLLRETLASALALS